MKLNITCLKRSHGSGEVLSNTGSDILFILSYFHLFLMPIYSVLSVVAVFAHLVKRFSTCTRRTNMLAVSIIAKSKRVIENT